jgi:hypothetical protein
MIAFLKSNTKVIKINYPSSRHIPNSKRKRLIEK